MHLRTPDPLAYLALRKTVDEAKAEHLALDRGQHSPAARERLAVVRKLEPLILAPEPV